MKIIMRLFFIRNEQYGSRSIYSHWSSLETHPTLSYDNEKKSRCLNALMYIYISGNTSAGQLNNISLILQKDVTWS